MMASTSISPCALVNQATLPIWSLEGSACNRWLFADRRRMSLHVARPGRRPTLPITIALPASIHRVE